MGSKVGEVERTEEGTEKIIEPDIFIKKTDIMSTEEREARDHEFNAWALPQVVSELVIYLFLTPLVESL
jgi:hypothetical protein